MAIDVYFISSGQAHDGHPYGKIVAVLPAGSPITPGMYQFEKDTLNEPISGYVANNGDFIYENIMDAPWNP